MKKNMVKKALKSFILGMLLFSATAQASVSFQGPVNGKTITKGQPFNDEGPGQGGGGGK